MASVCTVTNVTSTWQERIQNEKYRNWVKIWHALYITFKGIRPYIEKQAKNVYAAILFNLRTAHLCTCVYTPGRLDNPWHDMRTCRWAKELKRHCRGDPLWYQSNSAKWSDRHIGYWEVAKLYMSDLGQHASTCVDASSTDATGLLNLMSWCTAFKVNRGRIGKVRETRNFCGHAPQQELDGVQTTNAFTAIKDLLQVIGRLGDKDAQDALVDITNLETGDIVGFEEIELKVVNDFIEVTKNEIIRKLEVAERISGEESAVLREEITEQTELLNQVSFILKAMKENQTDLQTDVAVLTEFHVRVDSKLSQLLHCAQQDRFISRLPDLVVMVILNCMMAFAVTLREMHRIVPKQKYLVVFLCLLSFPTILEHSTIDYGCNSVKMGDFLQLKQFDFTDSLSFARDGFIGRQWLFENITTSLEDDKGKKGVLITGPPGSGKSAIAANLICSKLSTSTIHSKILGYHMCSYSDKSTLNGAKFVLNLVNMISWRLLEYRELIQDDSFIQRVLHECVNDPIGCFEQAVIIPLEHVRGGFQKPMYIIIDALDECFVDTEQNNEDSIVALLSTKLVRLPAWIKVILTSRNVANILREFAHVDVIEIGTDNPYNLRDIEEYVSLKFHERSSLLSRLRQSITGDTQSAISTLVRKSQGNFLYVKLILDHLASEEANLNLEDLPTTISSTYHTYFKRKYRTVSEFLPVRGIFEVIIASSRPLMLKELFDVLYGKDKDINFEYDFLPIMESLGIFLQHSRHPNSCVNIFHNSLSEWLTSDATKGGRFHVSKKMGIQRLADYIIGKIDEDSFNQETAYLLANDIAENLPLQLRIILQRPYRAWGSRGRYKIFARFERILLRFDKYYWLNSIRTCEPTREKYVKVKVVKFNGVIAGFFFGSGVSSKYRGKVTFSQGHKCGNYLTHGKKTDDQSSRRLQILDDGCPANDLVLSRVCLLILCWTTEFS